MNTYTMLAATYGPMSEGTYAYDEHTNVRVHRGKGLFLATKWVEITTHVVKRG
jgi:hypothetical protein